MRLRAVRCGKQQRGRTPGDEAFPDLQKHSLT
jgi:hypothetical protein